jgi:hypothetical protein
MNTADLTRAHPLAPASARAAVPAWFGVALVFGLWLLARPYLGVRHDGELYLGQTLQQLYPGLLDRDLFFAFGSQDRFSLFSSVQAGVQRMLGLPGAQLSTMFVCHAALVGAAAWLLRPLHSPAERWLALASLAVLSHFYGGNGIFSFAETFVTARTLAEPLSLLALALWVGHWRKLALVAWLVALAAHPLVALPVAAVVCALLVQENRRWLGLLAALPLLAIPAALGIAPFSGLLLPMQGTWLKVVQELSSHLYVSHWLAVDAMVVLLDVSVLAAIARTMGPQLGGLARAMLAACLALFAVSWVGADLLHNQLVTALQLWRVQWLAHLLVVMLLPVVLWRQWSSRLEDQVLVLACALAACAINGNWDSSWALGLVAAGAWAARRRACAVSPGLWRLARAVLVLALAGLSVALAARSLLAMHTALVEVDASLAVWAFAKVPTVSLGGVAVLIAAWRRPRWTLASVAAVLLLLAWASSTWDRRSDLTREIERAEPGSHPFSARIPPGAQVYWPDRLAATWAWLGRPSYFTHQQGAGMLFNQDTALEFERRREPLRTLLMQGELCGLLGAVSRDPHAHDECVPDQQVLDDICRHASAPDFMVLPFGQLRGIVDSWSFTNQGRTRTLHLYDCNKLR